MSNFKFLSTGIGSLDNLLVQHGTAPENPAGLPKNLLDQQGCVQEANSQKQPQKGIAYHPSIGFFGIIFGAAGSGKSILSLQLCCEFAKTQMSCEFLLNSKQPLQGRHAIFLTSEPFEVVRAKIEQFGFRYSKESKRPKFVVLDEFDIPKKWEAKNLKSSLTIIQMPLEPKRQRPKLEYLFRLVEDNFKKSCTEKTASCPGLCKERILICVDNAETLHKSAFPDEIQKSEEGNQSPFFFKKLREYCATRRINTWFTFEEKQAETSLAEEVQASTTEEAYAADIVIRLGMKVFASGFRERSFEIIKAKNQEVRRGRHHFSIRGRPNALDTRSKANSANATDCGFVIYPSLATQLHELAGANKGKELAGSHKGKEDSAIKFRLGIDEVDQAISLENPQEAPSQTYLAEGTVSVLVSDLDSLASEIALHFACQDRGPSLYISTLHDEALLGKMKSRYTEISGRPTEFHQLCPEHISEGKLLQDIQRKIGAGNFKRVVFDNVFELSRSFPLLYDEKHFINALFSMFRHEKVAALVVDMVEVGEGHNPLSGSFAAGKADHVFNLRHAELRSGLIKVFSVLKLAGLREPKKLWDLAEEKERIRAGDRLAFYKGVLSGKIEPVEVKLSIFGESADSPLHKHIAAKEKVLRETFGQNIKVHICNSDTYSALQQSVEAGNLNALGDCHVISIDEIWLSELIKTKKVDGNSLEELKSKHWKRADYITAGQDIALGKKSGEEFNYAIPDRNNVGIITYNPGFLDEWRASGLSSRFSEEITQIATEVLEPLLHDGRLPCCISVSKQNFKRDLKWGDLINLQTRYIQLIYSSRYSPADLNPSCYRASHAKNGTIPSAGLFSCALETRECYVSFYLELLLSLLVEKNYPVKKNGKLNWRLEPDAGWMASQGLPETKNAWAAALVFMMKLLSPWDIMHISQAWFQPSATEPPCLFSRQWFSGWGTLGQNQPGLSVLELPKGAADVPTPVSGAWYLGILKGSTAIEAGIRIIKQLTSPEDELTKFNRGIAMPVRRNLWGNSDMRSTESTKLIAARQLVPYDEHFQSLGQAMNGDDNEKWTNKVLRSRCPFYRQVIKDYRLVSPLLMGMIVESARIMLRHENHGYLFRSKAKEDFGPLMLQFEILVKDCEKQYRNYLPLKSRSTSK